MGIGLKALTSKDKSNSIKTEDKIEEELVSTNKNKGKDIKTKDYKRIIEEALISTNKNKEELITVGEKTVDDFMTSELMKVKKNVEIKAENSKLKQDKEEIEVRFIKLEQSDREKTDLIAKLDQNYSESQITSLPIGDYSDKEILSHYEINNSITTNITPVTSEQIKNIYDSISNSDICQELET
ncbi:5511_t:CDS:2 [Diversispora eburnea]|uniref:5511_t:CDS:1 n=1 Tax=Diversispora eburnea TaxID=1213867 RepID=A0A9N9AEY4_9GLOM|nr:5511_t:CDS:2 [Diversispora eburnea]